MSKRPDIDLLRDIREAARRIGSYAEGMDYDRFAEDLKTQDAVIRNLETIGEAAKNVSAELRLKHPDLPWKGMAGVRDRLIHHYFGVNLDVVWDIVVVELPDLRGEVEAILEQTSSDDTATQ